MKLDDLPLPVLIAMRDRVVQPDEEQEDRATLRLRNAGYYVLPHGIREDGPTEEIAADDKLRPGEQAVVLKFRRAG